MKKVIIIGASGSLARFVVDAIKALDETRLTLFVRNRRRLHQGAEQGTTVIEGDAMDYHSVRQAIGGQDIVYVNLAGDLETMGSNIVKAMQDTHVERIIAISSIGIYQTPLRPVLTPYRKLADIVENSGLTYTILRPDWFTSDDEIDYALTQKGEPESGNAISRKSIAAFVAKIVENPDLHQNENLGISKP
ncbi:NAD(P)H-binding protein [Dyadobacter sp. CY107]|uniref:NAD(P)H-binding protein n=1 Tax=Dyadobacter fanqingshengii TaxID=2906443 RepID=UPI001F2965B0|nr:NAD(P)H-binding protein [Dyadobacter fanqingshengii]MCF2502055.1 NAD(P)H-binding protein [Dyadobacter fanqingshengii]